MTRDDAQAEAGRRNREAAAGGTGMWAPQRTPEGDWRVVHLVGGGLGHPKATGAHVESKPKPNEPDDPRPAIFRNIPPYGPG